MAQPRRPSAIFHAVYLQKAVLKHALHPPVNVPGEAATKKCKAEQSKSQLDFISQESSALARIPSN
jgi:hypothetical protein